MTIRSCFPGPRQRVSWRRPLLTLAVACCTALGSVSPQGMADIGETHPDPDSADLYGDGQEQQIMTDSKPDSFIRCQDGMADIFPCRNVDLLAHIPLDELGGGSGADSWGWVDSDTAREYALIGRSTGVTFVDVTTPTQPRVVGQIPRNDITTAWTDVKVFKDYAFIVADGVPSMGMQVFDLKRLADVSDEPVTFEPDTVYREFSSAHNIVINEQTGFAYAVGGDTCNSGAHIVDINDPRV